jgi:hypothetical protein
MAAVYGVVCRPFGVSDKCYCWVGDGAGAADSTTLVPAPAAPATLSKVKVRLGVSAGRSVATDGSLGEGSGSGSGEEYAGRVPAGEVLLRLRSLVEDAGPSGLYARDVKRAYSDKYGSALDAAVGGKVGRTHSHARVCVWCVCACVGGGEGGWAWAACPHVLACPLVLLVASARVGSQISSDFCF